MKKLYVVLMGLFSAALWGNAAFCQEVKEPIIAIEKTEFDFKEVREGTILEHTFTIVNKGNEVLEIISVKPG